MTDLRITVSVDIGSADRELGRLAGAPDFRAVGALEAVLQAAFEETQQVVHVITGSLRGSGKTSSDVDRVRRRWVGDIAYGGPSPGFPFDPVRYAVYEKARGGAHDFFHSLHLYNHLYEQAILDWMRGDA